MDDIVNKFNNIKSILKNILKNIISSNKIGLIIYTIKVDIIDKNKDSSNDIIISVQSNK